LSLLFNADALLNKSFREAVLLSIFLFPTFVLPPTLGAIIISWLISGTQTLGENFRNPEKIKIILGEHFRKKIKIILRSIRTLLACLHSLFRKVLFK
jgi:hypothetical protein